MRKKLNKKKKKQLGLGLGIHFYSDSAVGLTFLLSYQVWAT